MQSFLSTIRSSMEKRTLYNRTVGEIRRMPRDVALDLNIFPEDAEKIAYKAVYGG
ncbi:hypothetical protein KUH32_14855 [Thalassococcus sp. CAU 1522]|uniref:Uncharacterized protein n=1 Tax=Thalassococcus arenae TaxID=2851652 RepID=A0ABS6NAJ0_9RHOB|nr:hypothetical protein [Thalassococcus arenae]MBV2361042.1 hypothetical protein [Thalassococcus arenae]